MLCMRMADTTLRGFYAPVRPCIYTNILRSSLGSEWTFPTLIIALQNGSNSLGSILFSFFSVTLGLLGVW
ncbi:hypothetical protein BDV36DRAFT_256423 [Aspergillus pseudocaelatus]|uniref:Uncharacterized protein n=1 Tax=Aspergillus pseudocaelatus TaxID=1825620 RepID=A0ABQ6WKJ4_9EURO|nr:hypothetical protein BDV36DRAFT_256423 [Aspergillus pseudocaelatus]